jgi:hypothetical protein
MQNMTLVFVLGGLDTDKLWETWTPHQAKLGSLNLRLRRIVQEAHERGELPPFGGPWVRGAVKGVRPGEVYVNMVRRWGDATDVLDLTQAEIEARRDVMAFVKFLKENVPELASCHLVQTGVQIGLRETRRLLGDYVLTRDDVVDSHPFPDVVARGAHPIDIHPRNATEDQSALFLKEDYGVPYRCLLPQGSERLLVTGRCISVTHEALATTRVMGTCMALGEAAGTAAALAVQEGISPRLLDAQKLQARLQAQGAII